MSDYGPPHNAEASKPLVDWRDAEIERLRRELARVVELGNYMAREFEREAVETVRLERELAEAQSKLNVAEAEVVSVKHWAERELAEARGLLIQADQTISELAEQQAMPDEFYMQTLDRIDAFLTAADQPDAAPKDGDLIVGDMAYDD